MISSGLRKGETPHRTVGPAAGEFARDDDGEEGFFEVPINTPEDFRSEPHPRRGARRKSCRWAWGLSRTAHKIP